MAKTQAVGVEGEREGRAVQLVMRTESREPWCVV